MRTLRRGISYNRACAILEANHYGITETKAIGIKHEWTGLYKNGELVARYHEPTGRLQVR